MKRARGCTPRPGSSGDHIPGSRLRSDAGTNPWGRLRWVLRAGCRVTLYASLACTALMVLLAPWVCTAILHKEDLILPLTGLSLTLPLIVLYTQCTGGLRSPAAGALSTYKEAKLAERLKGLGYM